LAFGEVFAAAADQDANPTVGPPPAVFESPPSMVDTSRLIVDTSLCARFLNPPPAREYSPPATFSSPPLIEVSPPGAELTSLALIEEYVPLA
jgi:hypothetical protein